MFCCFFFRGILTPHIWSAFRFGDVHSFTEMIDVVGPEGTRTLIRIFSNTSQNIVLQKCAVASLKEFSFSLCATYCFSFTVFDSRNPNWANGEIWNQWGKSIKTGRTKRCRWWIYFELQSLSWQGMTKTKANWVAKIRWHFCAGKLIARYSAARKRISGFIRSR